MKLCVQSFTLGMVVTHLKTAKQCIPSADFSSGTFQRFHIFCCSACNQRRGPDEGSLRGLAVHPRVLCDHHLIGHGPIHLPDSCSSGTRFGARAAGDQTATMAGRSPLTHSAAPQHLSDKNTAATLADAVAALPQETRRRFLHRAARLQHSLDVFCLQQSGKC